MPRRNAGLFRAKLLVFATAKIFSFFSWSEIRRISLRRGRASCLLVGGWSVEVGRNCLNSAQGVGAKSFSGGAKFGDCGLRIADWA
jgi:hypothetical protein